MYLVLSFNDASFKNNYYLKSLKISNDFFKRNIYFIGLDSLAGDEYYKSHFDANPFWSKEFEDIGFRKLNNVHTGGANSTRSFYLNLLSFKNKESKAPMIIRLCTTRLVSERVNLYEIIFWQKSSMDKYGLY